MKILIFSDSHGRLQTMVNAVFDLRPDMILHLGDCVPDCDELKSLFPNIPLRRVRGNCDFGSREIETDEFIAAGKRFFMTHGHKYSVKSGAYNVLNAAASHGADIVLYGHTHIPKYMEYDGMYLINPGSIGYDGNYGVLTILNGRVEYEEK